MKKFFTHIFLLGLIIFVTTGCPDPNPVDPADSKDFPSGNLYFMNRKNNISIVYKMSGPEYSLSTLFSHGRSPVKLSDGSMIYISDNGIMISKGNFASSDIILERDKINSASVWNGKFSFLVVNEDKQLIAFENDFSHSIYVINFKGELRWEINAKDSKEYIANPEFTNDGKLLFAGVNNKLGILEMDLESGEIKQLIEGSNNPSQPSLSTDGTQIAFTLNNNIWTANRDGSNMQMLTTDAKNRNTPVWSPDGKWIANLVKTDISFIRLVDKSELIVGINKQSTYPGFDGVAEYKLCWKSF